MPDVADQPAKPLRTWRPMAGWTLGILAALGLAWFVGAVVVPVWQVRAMLADERNYMMGSIDIDVARLGGAARAARSLSIYMQLPDRLAPRKRACADLLTRCEVYGVPALRKALDSCDVLVRLTAAADLVRKQDQRTRDRIAGMLVDESKSGDPDLRFYAACVMGDFDPPHKLLLPVLVGLLDDDGGFMAPNGPPGDDALIMVRQGALWSIGHYGAGAKALVPRIVRFLGDSNYRVRRAAADALKNIGPVAAESVPALLQLLDDKERVVRTSVAEALAQVAPNDPRTVPGIARLLADDDRYVRSVAAATLGEIVVAILVGARHPLGTQRLRRLWSAVSTPCVTNRGGRNSA